MLTEIIIRKLPRLDEKTSTNNKVSPGSVKMTQKQYMQNVSNVNECVAKVDFDILKTKDNWTIAARHFGNNELNNLVTIIVICSE